VIKRLLVAMLGLGMIGVLMASTPASAQPDGTVYVVHGIPGVTVDVYVNGAKTLSSFAPKTVAGPLSLPAGAYTIKIYKAGADPATATPVIDSTVQLPAGADVSLVADLSASGTPQLATFVNDTAAAAAGKGRLIVRHTADAPAVDILAGGSKVFTGLVNGQGDQADLAAGTVRASVVATATTTSVLIGPANLTVVAGMATVVYAIGAPASGSTASTLGVVTQQLPLAGAQMSVQAGTSGLLDRPSGPPAWAIGVLVLAGLGLCLSVGSLARSRTRL
jgi:hypothetical protein